MDNMNSGTDQDMKPVAFEVITAPKDGTMMRLLVDYTGEDSSGRLEDEDQAWTIGFNDLDNTGDDEWKFAGWCWSHDHFTEGHGVVIGWLPLHAPCDVMRAEITQLRAAIAAERELADRMYGALEYIDDYCLAYPELESISAVSSSAIEYVDTRRNK